MKHLFFTMFFVSVLSLQAQGEIVNTTFPASSFGGDALDVSTYPPKGYDAKGGLYQWVTGSFSDSALHHLGINSNQLPTKMYIPRLKGIGDGMPSRFTTIS